jgi:tetratricopeptide (TPR) repeat protein
MQPGQLSRKLALIVGVNSYQDSTFQPLRFAENDAKALAQWLVNTKGGKWNPPDVQLVQGQHATTELVESLLAQLHSQVAETGDEVVFYFAGHAFVDERSGDGYLALANTRYQDTRTAINVRTLIQSTQSQSHAGQTLCIFDCFQTGPAWDTRRTAQYDTKPLLGTATLATLQQLTNRLCLCSCRGNAFAGETGERTLGMFAHRLVLGLSGPATESAIGGVTLTKLHAYLFRNLPEQHRPQLFGQQTSPFVLVGNPVPVTTTNALSSPSHSNSPTGQGFTKTSEPSKSGLLRMYGSSSAPSLPVSTLADADQARSLSGSLPKEQSDEQQENLNQQILEQARQYIQDQNYKEAFDLVEQVLQTAPDDIAALILKGHLLNTAGRLADATATVEYILQKDPNNAAAWSLRAVLLNKMGQPRAALSAIERSLEIDPNNPESYGIKKQIMQDLATAQVQNSESAAKLNASRTPISRGASPMTTKNNSRASLIGAILQILGFIVGVAGAASTYFLPPTVPPYAGLALASVGFATLCVLATQGAFRYGFKRFLLTTLLTLLSAAILGGTYVVLGFTRISANIQAQIGNQAPIARLLAFSFIALWLIAAAIVPFIGALIGLIAGLIVRAIKRDK